MVGGGGWGGNLTGIFTFRCVKTQVQPETMTDVYSGRTQGIGEVRNSRSKYFTFSLADGSCSVAQTLLWSVGGNGALECKITSG